MTTPNAHQQQIVEQWNRDEEDLARLGPRERIDEIIQRLNDSQQRTRQLWDIWARAIDDLRREVGVTAAASELGVSRQTVHRTLGTLSKSVIAEAKSADVSEVSVDFDLAVSQFVRFEGCCAAMKGVIRYFVDDTQTTMYESDGTVRDLIMPHYLWVSEGHHRATIRPDLPAVVIGPLEIHIIDQEVPEPGDKPRPTPLGEIAKRIPGDRLPSARPTADGIPRPSAGDIAHRGRRAP